MASWLANLTQAVQDRLESFVDDSGEPQESAQHVQGPQNEASLTDAVDTAIGNSRGNAPVSVAVDGADDLLAQLEEQKALIDALKALIREKESKNFEQEQLIKEMQAMQRPDFGGRTAELEHTIEELRLAMRAKEELMQTLHEQQARFGNRQPAATELHESADVDELMRSVSKKDNAILSLQDRIQELEQKMMDLQELVNEKDEVIHGRNQAIKVMQEQLATRDSALKQSSDSYVALKAEFTTFQEWFAAQEGTWSERLAEYRNAYALAAGQLEQTQRQLLDMQIQHADVLSSRDADIAQLQAAVAEHKGKPFTAANADVTAVVAANSSATAAVADEGAVSGRVEATAGGSGSVSSCDPRDKELADLKKSLHEQSTKMLKMKAQALAKVKALQKELEDAKQAVPSAALSAELMDLHNRIAEIEEEKGNLQLQLVDMDEVKTTSAKLTQELEVALASLKQAQLENSDLTQTLQDLRQASAHAEEAGKTEQAQHAAEVALLRSKLQELQQQCDSTTADVVAERDRSNRLSAELCSALTSLDEMQRFHTSDEAENTSLKTRLSHFDAALAAATEAKVTSELRMAELEETRDCLLKDKAELATAVGNLERQLALLQQLHEPAAAAAAAAATDSASDAAQTLSLHRESHALQQQSNACLQQFTQSNELRPLAGHIADAEKTSGEEFLHISDASSALAGQLQAACDDSQRLELTADSGTVCLTESQNVECEESGAAGLLNEAASKRLKTETTADSQAAVIELRRQHADALSAVQAELQLRHEEQIVELRQQHADALSAMHAELQRSHEEQIIDLRQQHADAVAMTQDEWQRSHEEQIIDLRKQHADDVAAIRTELQRAHEEQFVDLRQKHAVALAAMQTELQRCYEQQIVDLQQQHADTVAAMQTELERGHEQQMIDLRQQQTSLLPMMQAELQRGHEEQIVNLQQKHAETLAATQAEQQRRHEGQIVDLQQQHAGTLAAMQAELQRRHEKQIIDLQQEHADAVSSLSAKYHAELASCSETAAATKLQHDNAVVTLRKELDAANARVAALEQQVAAAAREADVSAVSWSRHRVELEQQLSAYRESQSLLADQLRVLIDERSSVDAAAARDRQELQRANALACARLSRIAADGHAALPDALEFKEPATVEDAIRLGESTILALREKLQATEDRLALLQQEQSVQAATVRTDDVSAKHLPALLLAKATELLPREKQPTAETAAADWCACLLDELVEWRARQESTAAELKASSVRHAEKIASLASNLQEVESQLTTSASEAESLRSELSVCRQQLACAEAEALQKLQQSATTAGSAAAAAAAEHEANLRKYAAAIKKLKADIVVKEKEAAAASDLSRHLNERLRALLLHCRARAVAAGLRPDGSSSTAAVAYGCDDSGLDASMSLSHDPLAAVGEPPASLTVDSCIELVQQLFDTTGVEAAARCAAAEDTVADLRRSLARRDAELQDLLRQTEAHGLDDTRRAAELETLRMQAAAGVHLGVQLDEARAEVARLCSELDTARTRCEQIELSARNLAEEADNRCRAAETEREAQQAASRARTDKMLAKLRQLKDRGDELQSRLDAAEARANAAEAASSAVAESRQHLEERCTTAERNAAAAAIATAAETTALHAELNRLRAVSATAVVDAEAQISALQETAAEVVVLRERADQALAARAVAEAEAAELRSQVDEVLRQQAATEAEAAELRLQVDDMLRRQAAAEAEAAQQAATEAEAAELRLQVDDMLRRQAAAEAEAAKLHLQVDGLLAAKAAAEAEAASLRSQVEDAVQRQAAAEAESSHVLADARNRQQVLEAAAEAQAAVLRSRIEELSMAAERESAQQLAALEASQLEAAAALANERRQLNATLDMERSQAQLERLVLERRVAEAEERAARAQLDAEVERSTAAEQRQSLERRLAEAHSQYSMLEADHREFERVAATLRDAKMRLEREVHDLRRRLGSNSSSSATSTVQPTLQREVVQPLGSAADATTTALLQKHHANDVAAHYQSGENRVAGRAAMNMSVAIMERLEALCVLAASAPTASQEAPPQPFDPNNVEACIGVLHDRMTQLLAVATKWRAEQAELLARQQATGAELQRRDRDCQQLAAKVEELSQSLQGLSQQHSQVTAALQHATVELQHLQGLQRERQRDHSPSRDHALLATRITELEAACQRLEKDLDEARRREAGSILSESSGASAREHAVYIEDPDESDPSASNELNLTAGITAGDQLPLLRRAGRLVEQGVPMLRALTRRQASRLRRLLRSQPRPQLLLLAYALLLHVLVLGACFGNWFCP